MAVKAEESPKKIKGTRWVLVFLAFILMSAGVCLFLTGEYKKTGAQASAIPVSAAEMKSVTLPSFTVNLVDTRSRYLRTTITLESPDKKVEKELTASPYRVKDSILRVLRNTSASNLEDPQQIEVLKQELLKEINASLSSGEVTAIYFDEFIFQ